MALTSCIMQSTDKERREKKDESEDSSCDSEIDDVGYSTSLVLCKLLIFLKFFHYRSLAIECPPPTLGPISCIGSKSNE